MFWNGIKCKGVEFLFICAPRFHWETPWGEVYYSLEMPWSLKRLLENAGYLVATEINKGVFLYILGAIFMLWREFEIEKMWNSRKFRMKWKPEFFRFMLRYSEISGTLLSYSGTFRKNSGFYSVSRKNSSSILLTGKIFRFSIFETSLNKRNMNLW